MPFADASHDFTGKATFNLLWHALDGTRGLVPCDRMCASVDYYGGNPGQVMAAALDDAMGLLAGTGVLPGTHGAHGFGTSDITKWGWVPAQNKDWADLDPVANAAADLGLLRKPDLGTSGTENRSTWMQSMDVGPSGDHGRQRAAAGRERLHRARRHVQPPFRGSGAAVQPIRVQADAEPERVTRTDRTEEVAIRPCGRANAGGYSIGSLANTFARTGRHWRRRGRSLWFRRNRRAGSSS